MLEENNPSQGDATWQARSLLPPWYGSSLYNSTLHNDLGHILPI